MVVPIPGGRLLWHRDTKVGPMVWQMSQFWKWKILKNSSTLAVSVPVKISIKLGFVSVNCLRETYFVETLHTTVVTTEAEMSKISCHNFTDTVSFVMSFFKQNFISNVFWQEIKLLFKVEIIRFYDLEPSQRFLLPIRLRQISSLHWTCWGVSWGTDLASLWFSKWLNLAIVPCTYCDVICYWFCKRIRNEGWQLLRIDSRSIAYVLRDYRSLQFALLSCIDDLDVTVNTEV